MYKLRAFGLKVSSFPGLLVVYPCHRSFRMYYGLVAGVWHLKQSLSSLALGLGLVVKLQIMQQLTILVTLSSNQKSVVIGV